MKKLAVALIALMVLSIGAPAMAAELNFSGSLDTSINWREKDTTNDDGELIAKGWAAENTVNLELGLTAGGEDKGVSAHLELSPVINEDGLTFGDDLTEEFGGDARSSYDFLGIKVDKAWIETNGAFWNGGPAVSTRIGTLDVQHSDLVATVEKNGVSIDGVEFGPVSLGGFAAWNTDRDLHNGANMKADLGLASMNASVVKADQELAYAVEGSAAPVDGVAIDGLYAAERNEGVDGVAQIYKVDATVVPVENIKITAGYRNLMDGVNGVFAPTYYKETTDDDDYRTDLIGIAQGLGEDGKADQNAGYNVGIETTQSGITMNASYDNPRHEAVVGANTELAGYKLGAEVTFDEANYEFEYAQAKLTAEKDFDINGIAVNGKYTATLAKDAAPTHELEAKSTLNAIPQLQGLELNGKVTVENTDEVTWNAGAKYAAPNGIELGAGYDSEDGASFSAGVKVEF